MKILDDVTRKYGDAKNFVKNGSVRGLLKDKTGVGSIGDVKDKIKDRYVNKDDLPLLGERATLNKGRIAKDAAVTGAAGVGAVNTIDSFDDVTIDEIIEEIEEKIDNGEELTPSEEKLYRLMRS